MKTENLALQDETIKMTLKHNDISKHQLYMTNILQAMIS